MAHSRWSLFVALIPLVAGVLIGGCGAPPRTSQLRASDIEFATTEVSQQLAESEFLRTRTATSPVVVLQPRPMENLSDNRLSRGDQWAAMSMILMNPSVFEMLRSKNVQILVPLDSRYDATRAGITSTVPSGAPTHVFQPVLRSITRAGSEGSKPEADTRKDLFLMEYSITELQSRRVVWGGQTSFARVAHGKLID